MPNTGKPSKDCHLCRSRRVKCDLARPECQRCIKYGTRCPGYRDELELVFRSTDPQTIKKRSKRNLAGAGAGAGAGPAAGPAAGRGPRSQASSKSASPDPDLNAQPESYDFNRQTLLPAASSLSPEAVTSTPGFNEPCQQLALLQPLEEHWTAHSIPIVLSVYSGIPFLRDIFHQFTHDGPLVWAAHLFSRTYITNQRYPTAIATSSLTENQEQLGVYLGKTLSAINSSLRNRNGPKRDDVLAAIWVLTNYELLIGSITEQGSSAFNVHTNGLYSIIKARGTRGFQTTHGRRAFWLAFNMVQVQAIVINKESPPETQEWLDALENTDTARIPLLVARFVTTACYVNARAYAILCDDDSLAAMAEYSALVDTITRAEDEFVMNPGLKEGASAEMDTYMKVFHWAVLVKCFHMLQALATYLTHYPSAGQTSRENLLAHRNYFLDRCRSSAQAVLEYMPLIIDFMASQREQSPPKLVMQTIRILWPLTTICNMPSTLPEQKAQAWETLFMLGKSMGVRQALHHYPGNLPFPATATLPQATEEELAAGRIADRTELLASARR